MPSTERRTYVRAITVEVNLPPGIEDAEADAALDSVVEHSTAREAIEAGLLGWLEWRGWEGWDDESGDPVLASFRLASVARCGHSAVYGGRVVTCIEPVHAPDVWHRGEAPGDVAWLGGLG